MIGIIILVFDSENTVKLEAMYLLVVPKFLIAEQHDWKCKCHMASKTYTVTKCPWCAQNLPRVSIFDQNKRRVRLRLFSHPPRYLCQGREMCFSDSKSYISCQVHIVYHWSTTHPCNYLSCCHDLSCLRMRRHRVYVVLGPPVMPWDKLGMIPVLMRPKHGKQLATGLLWAARGLRAPPVLMLKLPRSVFPGFLQVSRGRKWFQHRCKPEGKWLRLELLFFVRSLYTG